MTEANTKKRRGCLFYAGIAVAVLVLSILAAVLVGMHLARRMLNEYTDLQPATLPTSSLAQSQVDQVQSRVKAFGQAVSNRRAGEPLELDSDQINALIATDPRFAPLRGKLSVTLDGDKVKGQVSVPMAQLGMPMFKSRYLNADVTLGVSFEGGVLQIVPESILVKGKPLPGIYMEKLRRQNFGQDLTQNPRVAAALERLQSITIKDSKLILVAKPQ